MATDTAGNSARELPFQAVHYLRMAIDWNTGNLTTGVPFPNYLPAGAEVIFTQVKVKTAFDGSASLTIGTNSTAFDNFMASAEIDETAVRSTTSFTGADVTLAADALPYVKVTSSSPSTGHAVIIIAYVVNNDA